MHDAKLLSPLIEALLVDVGPGKPAGQPCKGFGWVSCQPVLLIQPKAQAVFCARITIIGNSCLYNITDIGNCQAYFPNDRNFLLQSSFFCVIVMAREEVTL